jgi:hypothetical protein
MGKEKRKHRHNVIRRDLARREKIRTLREKYLAADTTNKQKLLAKLNKISPNYPAELLKPR